MRSAIFLIAFSIAALSISAAVFAAQPREIGVGVVGAWRDVPHKAEASIGNRIQVKLKNFDNWLMTQEGEAFPIPGHPGDVDDGLRKAIQDPAFRKAVIDYTCGKTLNDVCTQQLKNFQEPEKLLKEATTLIASKIEGLTLEINEIALTKTTSRPRRFFRPSPRRFLRPREHLSIGHLRARSD